MVITLLRRVRVLGSVARPGLYHIDPTMTMGDVVVLAGGVTVNGKEDDIKIIRDGKETDAAFSLAALALHQVSSGDAIMVPTKSWLTRWGAVIIAAVISATAIIITR